MSFEEEKLGALSFPPHNTSPSSSPSPQIPLFLHISIHILTARWRWPPQRSSCLTRCLYFLRRSGTRGRSGGKGRAYDLLAAVAATRKAVRRSLPLRRRRLPRQYHRDRTPTTLFPPLSRRRIARRSCGQLKRRVSPIRTPNQQDILTRRHPVVHEQNKEICDLQAQADRQRAVAIRSGRLAFVRQVANQALARENEGLRAAALARRRGRGRAGPRQQCMPGPQPAARASRQPRQPRRLPSPMGRRIGRPAKDNVMRPYPR